MRILVYGAGVIGCELAHVLNTDSNEVVLLARGAWKKQIEDNGLIIKHCGYFHTTVDHINVIETLADNDYFDLIFVVMTYQNVIKIIPNLRKNCSKNIIFVGNNASPEEYVQMLNSGLTEKKDILFGFTGIGGNRKIDKIISMHPLKISLRLGGLETFPDNNLMTQIQSSFSDTICNIEWEKNMKGWLLTHLAFILPTTYICYHSNYKLWKTNKATMDLMLDAVEEAHLMLKEAGYQIRPENEDDKYISNRRKQIKKLVLLFKTPAGKFIISNHCKHGVREMMELDQSFEIICKKTNIAMPAWDSLRLLKQPEKERIEVSECI